jgi:hypothetical protein
MTVGSWLISAKVLRVVVSQIRQLRIRKNRSSFRA